MQHSLCKRYYSGFPPPTSPVVELEVVGISSIYSPLCGIGIIYDFYYQPALSLVCRQGIIEDLHYQSVSPLVGLNEKVPWISAHYIACSVKKGIIEEFQYQPVVVEEPDSVGISSL